MGVTSATVSPSNMPQQSDWQDPTGAIYGKTPTDKIAFYGNAPIVQPAGQGEVADTRGQAGASVLTIYSATASPTAVGPNTTLESGLTLMAATVTDPIATGDLLFVNKIAAQAGLGVGNVRVSASNVAGVTFSNFTAATLTPTATRSYVVVAIRGFTQMTATITPTAVAPNVTVEQQFSVSGIRAADLVQANKPTSQAGLDIVNVRAVSTGVIGITFANLTAATITPTAGESYNIISLTGIDEPSNTISVEEVQSPAATTNSVSAASQNLTFTGLATTDIVTGVQKPTLQAGLGIVGAVVTAANTLAVSFANFTAATITPTATEVYAVVLYRPNPVAPLVVFTQTITPTSVAANTTAEQTFAITSPNGLIAGTPVWVNKPSFTQGIAIAGVRVSAANTLAINFGNLTAAAITPPSEAYVIGNFQVPYGDAGSTWVQPVSGAATGAAQLSNALRSALVSLGLMAGS